MILAQSNIVNFLFILQHTQEKSAEINKEYEVKGATKKKPEQGNPTDKKKAQDEPRKQKFEEK